ncbi:hypothetical protein [Psychrobacter sp. 72-O-c]|uniref:hypothetical protein n=1 Tax=Psychrobacter sp. 72-O-c TaxID=2774125 RepID=UPI0019197F55|nr:hypothetical protein [Psychrobacter sp. 72-O-c]
MCIYLTDNAVFMIIFIVGLVLGAIVHRIITAPMNNEDRKSLEVMRYELEAFEKRNRPPPPKPLHHPPPLKKPKK